MSGSRRSVTLQIVNPGGRGFVNALILFVGLIICLVFPVVNCAAQPVAIQRSASVYTPGSLLTVTNTLSYTGSLVSLLWRPQLPAAWSNLAVTVVGDGSPEYRLGEILFTGNLPAGTLIFSYSFIVPTNAAGIQTLRADYEYQLAGMINPATRSVSPEPLVYLPGNSDQTVYAVQQAPTTYLPGDTLFVTNTVVFNGALASLLIRPTIPPLWNLISVTGDGHPEWMGGEIVFTGLLPTNAVKVIYGVTAPTNASGSQSFYSEVEYQLNGMINPALTYGVPDPLVLSLKTNVSTLAAQQTADSSYIPVGILQVTNQFTYSGSLISVLLRPLLPSGWIITNVSGDANPEFSSGEIVFTGTLHSNRFQVLYSVAIPTNATGPLTLRAELEYQFNEMVNPVLMMVTPDPLVIPYTAPGPTVRARQSAPSFYQTNVSYRITNVFEHSDPLSSLLWRPSLPSGWTFVSVTGSGNPEWFYGEVVFTGSLSTNPLVWVCELQPPTSATNYYTFRGEVEYQVTGMVNPASVYASPDALLLRPVPAKPRLTNTVFSSVSQSMNFTLAGETGLVYQVWMSTNLAQWQPYLLLTNTTGTVQHEEPILRTISGRFFKTSVQ
ncbi:MAG: hypothetical protein WCO56_24515 [Verrucomicrobiota bacterium]